MRPYGFSGKPLALAGVNSVQCSPASVDLKSPLPGPPERNVHASRRKSHMEAYKVFGSLPARLIMPQPVDLLAPANTLRQVLPPSLVLYTPPSVLSSQACPVAQA